MASTIPFTLITPLKIAFSGQAELVIVTTTEGEEGILAHHAPFLAALKPGVLRANVIVEEKPQRLEFATRGGFIQALPDGLTVLVDEALGFDDVDVAAARTELADATDPLALEFAAAKLRLTGH